MMEMGRGVLLAVLCGGMEICWLYAWAAFSMTAITQRAFSFPGAIGAFVLAAILTNLSMGRGWRIIYVVVLYLFGFACAALWVLYAMGYPLHPAFNTAWLRDLFAGMKTLREWFELILTLFWALLFWIGGMTLSRRSNAYFTICSRFDIGLAAFFCLFLAKLVLFVKGGVRVDDFVSPLSILPFFVLSLTAIGIVRVDRSVSRTFLPDYRSVGVIISFTAVVILSVGCLVLFFLPLLTSAAGVGYHVVKRGAVSALPIFERILRFMFAGREMKSEPTGGSTSEHTWDWLGSAQGSWWFEVLEKIITWGVKGVGVLIVFFVFGLLVFYLIVWLFSRTSLAQKCVTGGSSTSKWWVRLWAAVVLCCTRIWSRRLQYRGAVELYNALLRWGLHGGIPRYIAETPLEFSSRLGCHFPSLKREIRLVVDAFNEKVYGEIDLSDQQITQARSALYALQNPIHWPRRMKTRFFGN